MDHAKRSAAWVIAADIMATLANVNAGKGKRFKAEQFNRYPEVRAARRLVKPSELERL